VSIGDKPPSWLENSGRRGPEEESLGGGGGQQQGTFGQIDQKKRLALIKEDLKRHRKIKEKEFPAIFCTLWSKREEPLNLSALCLACSVSSQRSEQHQEKMVKYVLVTGGVLSGLGKGVISSSTGVILRSLGFRVTAIKIDPYINIDAGTMSPFEHGEVCPQESSPRSRFFGSDVVLFFFFFSQS